MRQETRIIDGVTYTLVPLPTSESAKASCRTCAMYDDDYLDSVFSCKLIGSGLRGGCLDQDNVYVWKRLEEVEQDI